MKQRLNILAFLFILLGPKLFAQVPNAFNYQAVVRDAQGNVIANSNESFKFEIHVNTPNGNVLYSEEQAATTNAFGLVTFQIGRGTSPQGNFSTVFSDQGALFLEVKRLVSGSYQSLGTQELISVPFAQNSKRISLPYYEALTGTESSNLLFGINDLTNDNTLNNPILFDLFTNNKIGLNVASVDKPSLISTGYNGEGILTSSQSTKPALVARALGNANGVYLEANSGTSISQLLLAESESDFARLSFASNANYAESQNPTNKWTLAAKTDAVSSNEKFNVFKTGSGDLLTVLGNGNVGIGSNNPVAKLEVAGQLKITGGNPAQGKVLTSDANGLASWQSAPGGGTGSFSIPYNSGTLSFSSVPIFSVSNTDSDGLEGISSYFNGVGVRGVNTFTGSLSNQTVGVLGVSSNGSAVKGMISGTGSPSGTAGWFYAPASGNAIQAIGKSSFSKSQNALDPTATVDIDGTLRLRSQTSGVPAVPAAGIIWFDGSNFKGSNGTAVVDFGASGGGGGFTLPYGGFDNSSTSFQIQNAGIGNIAIKAESAGGTGLVAIGTQFGIEGTGDIVGVNGYSNAQNNGSGLQGVADCSTCKALNVSSNNGLAINISKGGVADYSGDFARVVQAGGSDLTTIALPAYNADDMVFVQPIGGQVSYSLVYNSGVWQLLNVNGFQNGQKFNVMVVKKGTL